jgi:hypothetical protein
MGVLRKPESKQANPIQVEVLGRKMTNLRLKARRTASSRFKV